MHKNLNKLVDAHQFCFVVIVDDLVIRGKFSVTGIRLQKEIVSLPLSADTSERSEEDFRKMN